MSLYTGKEKYSDNWFELPIYDNVVKRVEKLAKIEKDPTFGQYLMFEWAPGIPIMYDMTENEDEE